MHQQERQHYMTISLIDNEHHMQKLSIHSSTVRVLLGHLFAVATPKPIVIRRCQFLNIPFGTSTPKRKAKVKFHYPFWFPNQKAEV